MAKNLPSRAEARTETFQTEDDPPDALTYRFASVSTLTANPGTDGGTPTATESSVTSINSDSPQGQARNKNVLELSKMSVGCIEIIR